MQNNSDDSTLRFQSHEELARYLRDEILPHCSTVEDHILAIACVRAHANRIRAQALEEQSASSADGDCPRCDRDVVAEIVVSSIGTGGPHTPRGDACTEHDPEGWRLFVHGERREGL